MLPSVAYLINVSGIGKLSKDLNAQSSQKMTLQFMQSRLTKYSDPPTMLIKSPKKVTANLVCQLVDSRRQQLLRFES